MIDSHQARYIANQAMDKLISEGRKHELNNKIVSAAHSGSTEVSLAGLSGVESAWLNRYGFTTHRWFSSEGVEYTTVYWV